MQVHERSLPGVGRKYTFRPAAGGELVVILHHSGRRELLYFGPGEDRPRMMLELADGEARELGAIMAGMLFQPEAVGDVSARLGAHAIEWHELDAGSASVGKAVSELETPEARVVAVIRGSDLLIPNPSPDTRLEPSDVVVVIGARGAVSDVRSRLAGTAP